MAPLSPLHSALWWLHTSNVLYVVGALFTLLTAAWVVYETRAVAMGRHQKFFLLSEVAGAISAGICLLGSIGAIHYGNVVSHLKDVQLAAYEKSADLKISQADAQAATAKQGAAAAEVKNSQLKIQLAQDERQEKDAQARLQSALQKNAQFTQSLAYQQAVMSKQIHTSPELRPDQIQDLSNELRPFSGQNVSIETTDDTVVERLAASIAMSLHHAGITTKQYATVMGALYEGVSVAVHSPADVPPVANALVIDLRQLGIQVHPVAVPKMVKPGDVTIFLGPS